jgi:methyl-accepting chemotaxis protein
MLKSLSLKTKLIGLCLLLAATTALVGGLGFYTSQGVSKLYNHVATVNLPNAMLLGEMKSGYAQMQIRIATMGLEKASPALIRKASQEIDTIAKDYSDDDKKYSEVPFVPGEQELYEKMDGAFKRGQEISAKITKLALSSEAADRGAMLQLIEKDYSEAGLAFRHAIDSLIAFQVKQSEISVGAAQSKDSAGQTMSLILTIGSFAFALIAGYITSNVLALTLNSLAQKLSAGATNVASASVQISGAGADLSSSATEQAAALQETVASIDEISAMINKNADNAKRSQNVAEASHKSASEGKVAVETMLQSIQDINKSNGDIMQQTASSNEEISNIVKIISEIGNKTKVINDIVFQTKLLSFNASVEAARAGEHGKGFSVVAEEVGNLAQMSGAAAKEISQLLEVSIQQVEKTVRETKSKIESLMVISQAKIEGGMKTAHHCGKSLDDIVTNVSVMNELVSQISTASQEQAQGVQEITRAMNQLDMVTQQNATATQQAASAAEELNGQANHLHSMVANLVQTVQGE